MKTPKCSICNNEMTEGPAIGDICYQCIKKAVKYYNEKAEGDTNDTT